MLGAIFVLRKDKEDKNMERKTFTMEELVAYCSQYGFIYQGSEIYGGLANTWDYGPLGTRLKNQIKAHKAFPPVFLCIRPQVTPAGGCVSSYYM